MSDTENIQYAQSSNEPYVMDTALEMRLSVDKILYEIEQGLRGQYRVPYFDEEKGVIKYKEKNSKSPKANEEGIQAIMNWVRHIVNTATVQGNFDDFQYTSYICLKQKELTKILIINSTKWQVEDCHLNYIVDSIMSLIEPFMSRTLGNLERASYNNTIRTTETHAVSGDQFAR